MLAHAHAQGAQALLGQACLQVPAKAQAQGAQAPPGQACLQVPAQAQGAQAPPGQACLQVPANAQAQGAQALPGQACLQVPAYAQARCTGPYRCQQRHRLKVHRPVRVRRARRCPHMYSKVHRPFRVRRAYRCQQGTGSRCTGPSGSGVLAGAHTLNQGAQAPPGQACPQAPANVADATGPQVLVAAIPPWVLFIYFVRRPRFSRCRRSLVPIAAQTVVGLVPGVPGSADAAGSHQVRSLLQHRPLWVLCQASRFSRCHRSSGSYCSMDHRGSIARRSRFNRVQHKPRGSCAGRSRFSRCHRSSGPYVVQTTGHLCQAAQAPGVYCGGWDAPGKFPSCKSCRTKGRKR